MRFDSIDPLFFFKSLFEKTPSEHLLEARFTLSSGFNSFAGIKRLWKETEQVEQWYKSAAETFSIFPHNIHFAPVSKKFQSGVKKAIGSFPALWMDLDNVTVTEVKDLIHKTNEINLVPNFVVSSGWGYYFFWVFSRPVFDMPVFEESNKSLSFLLGGDMQAVNASHTLRFPGSFNCKTNQPKYVEPFVIHNNRYDSEEMFERIKHFFGIVQNASSSANISTGSELHFSNATKENVSTTFKATDFKAVDIKTVKEKAHAFSFCPLVRTMIDSPDNFSYSGWMSLAGSLLLIYGESEGRKMFHLISSLSKNKYSSSNVDSVWDRVVEKGLKSWSCSKTSEGILCKADCKGFLSIISKLAWRMKSNSERESKSQYQR